MNKKTTFIFAFILGAASGSAVTWYSVKKKYEEIAQREIDSVKEVFAKKREKEQNKDVVAKNVTEDKKEKPTASGELQDVYLSFARQAQEQGISPHDIELAIETIKALRDKSK